MNEFDKKLQTAREYIDLVVEKTFKNMKARPEKDPSITKLSEKLLISNVIHTLFLLDLESYTDNFQQYIISSLIELNKQRSQDEED